MVPQYTPASSFSPQSLTRKMILEPLLQTLTAPRILLSSSALLPCEMKCWLLWKLVSPQGMKETEMDSSIKIRSGKSIKGLERHLKFSSYNWKAKKARRICRLFYRGVKRVLGGQLPPSNSLNDWSRLVWILALYDPSSTQPTYQATLIGELWDAILVTCPTLDFV